MEIKRKHSRKRDAILECLRTTDAHPSAEWVYSRLKPEIPDLSLGTVYRNLNLFKDSGEVISLGTVQGLERFDGRTDPHVHYVCTQCGRVIDLPGVELPEALIEAAQAVAQAPVTESRLTFYGPCSHCVKQNQNQE